MSTQRDQIEATLADLAVQQVSERLPSIFDYYLGFELLEKNDEGTRAAGILGFQIKNIMVYIPILFLNGRVKGTEMFQIVETDTYMSATKQWVEFLASRTPGSPGGPDHAYPRGGVGAAQLQIFRSPQVGAGKMASAKPDSFQKLASMQEDAEAFDLVDFLKQAGYGVYSGFMKVASENPAIMEGLLNFYSIDRLKIPKSEFAFDTLKVADLLTDLGDTEDTEPETKVVTDPSSVDATKLDDENKKVLMETGIAIIDNRPEAQKSILVKEETRQRFSTPEETSIYELVSRDLSLNKVLVGPSPFPVEAYSSPLPGYVIIDPETSYATYIHNADGGNMERRAPVVRHIDPDGKLTDKAIDGAAALSTAAVGKTYVLVNKAQKKISAPFRVANKTNSRFRAVTLFGVTDSLRQWGHRFPRPNRIESEHERNLRSPHGYGPAAAEIIPDGAWVEQVDLDTAEPYQNDGVLFVSSNFGLIEVKFFGENEVESAGYSSGMPCCADDEETAADILKEQEDYVRKDQDHKEKVLKVIPARMGDVNAAIHFSHYPDGSVKTASGVDRLNVYRESGGLRDYKVSWNRKTAGYRTKTDLIKGLFLTTGLPGADCRELADRAEQYQKVAEDIYCPKIAYDGRVEVPWPEMDDSAGSTDYSGTPIQERTQAVSVGTHEQAEIDPFNPDIADYGAISKQMQGGGANQLIERAAQSGVKQVFDAAALTMLLRTNRIQIQIESEYLPKLIRGIDTACRMLLQFYWHNADFAQTYGQDELAEFEDILLTQIKLGGQTVLFLKQKSVGSTMSGLNALDEAG